MRAVIRQMQNSKKGVTHAKAGVQGFSQRMDSRFRGNDKLGLLYLVQVIKIYPFKLIISPARMVGKYHPYERRDDQFEQAKVFTAEEDRQRGPR
jgi:hypothetical protein